MLKPRMRCLSDMPPRRAAETTIVAVRFRSRSRSRIDSAHYGWSTTSSCSTVAHVVEVGGHDTLMAKRGQYADLFGIQAAAYR
jgi:hypothetical protein